MKVMPLKGSPSVQRGAVLIVSLIILLVMTVVGVSSMMSSTLQERMAGNSRQRTLARYSAEAALRAGEEFLRTTVTSMSNMKQFNGDKGLYSETPVTGLIGSSAMITFDITDNDGWTDGNSRLVAEVGDTSGSNPDGILDLARQPRYVIEYLGREEEGSKDLNIIGDTTQVPSSDPHIFRITAIGWGQDSEFYSVMQSTYRTGSTEAFGYF